MIYCNDYQECRQILKKHLKKLPDTSLQDILPAEDVPPNSKASGQILKVKILELLSKIDAKEEMTEYIEELAQLQPLVIERLEMLNRTNSPKSQKAQELLKILQGNDLEPNNEFKHKKIKPLDIEEKNLIICPSLRKGGIFNNFTKWISSAENKDYSTIKKTSEPISPQKYPVTFEIATDISYALGIDNLELYLTRGEHSVGIRAYKGSPNFMTIGVEHLKQNSAYHLTYNELRFAIAAELTFLAFDFAKITSSDIWRGAMEKGNFVLDTFITLIPFFGSVAKALSYVSKLNKLASRVEKIGEVAKKGEKVLVTTSKTLTVAKEKLDKQTEKQKELIALSRLMQISADRGGLVFCGDIVSAVRAIFLTSKYLAPNIFQIQKYGLSQFLLKKENDKYVNQNLAIRLGSLFSFYLSDDFQTLRQKIIQNV